MRSTYVLLLATMLIWAGSFIFIKIGLEEIGPYNLAFYRFILASPILLILAKIREGLKRLNLRDFPKIVILSLTGVTLLYATQFTALMYTTATNASILINTSVIFIALISFIAGEKFTKLRVLGIVMSFIGVMMIISKGHPLEFFTTKTIFGDLLMILNGFLWSIYTITGKNLLEKYGPMTLTSYAFVLGSILLYPFAAYEGLKNPFEFSTILLTSIAYLAILCSVFAYVVWYDALQKMDAARVAVFIYLIPLFTAIMAYFALNEKIDVYTAFGGIITMIGIYLTEKY